MNEEIRLLLKLTEENAKYLAALKHLKKLSDESVAKSYSGILSRDDVEAAMRIAGLEDREVSIITFDNCEDVAYEGN